MTPAARIQAVIDILGELEKTNQPVDRHLRDWGRAHRFAGSKDRAAIGERIYAIQRRRAWLTWRMGDSAPRSLVIGSLLDERDIEPLFSGGGYGPSVLTDAERAAILKPPSGEPPPYVQGEYSEFLESELRRAFGDALPNEMAALQSRAPADLRVNTMKTTREDVLTALRGEGYEANGTPFSPFGIRIASGEAKLGRSALFESGAFEFQDEAAQIAALLCCAKPGLRVLDLAAGAGGKSLALAAIMRNDGEIVATDIRFDALVELERRAARAGATIIRTAKDLQGDFDIVLVDAPCSGTGTWRRQPELRWRLTQERIADVVTTQDILLTQAAKHVKPGGRLVYATCSILPSENEDRVAAFLKSHPDFAAVPAADVWRESADTAPPQNLGEFFRASPFSTQTDGFFTAILAWNA
jgi:16S rRNA (cytosine967-C5)-methyltransferase